MVAVCRSRIVDGHLKFLQMTCVIKGKKKNSGPIHYCTEANESKKIIDLLTHFLLHKTDTLEGRVVNRKKEK